MVQFASLTAIATAAVHFATVARRHAIAGLSLAPLLVCVSRRAVRMFTKTVSCLIGSVAGPFACAPLAGWRGRIGAIPFLVFREAAMTIMSKTHLPFVPPNPSFQRTAFGVR